MNSAELRALILNWISHVVYFQLFAVTGIALLTLALLGFRRWRGKTMARLDAEHGDLIVNELLGQLTGEPVVLMRRPKSQLLRYRSLRDSLFAQIQSLSGHEREYLVNRYEELEFFRDDVLLCASPLWWRRLEGISRIAYLNRLRAGPLFVKLKKDGNEIVAAQATFALSRLSHPLNVIQLSSLSVLLSSGRHSTLLQVIANWCQVHGFEAVLNAALKHPKPDLRHNAILAVLTVKTPDSGRELVKLLRSRGDLPVILVAETIRVLREIGDPEAFETVQLFARHADELVRQRALEFMIFAGMDEAQARALFAGDESPGVLRLLSEAGWLEKEAA